MQVFSVLSVVMALSCPTQTEVLYATAEAVEENYVDIDEGRRIAAAATGDRRLRRFGGSGAPTRSSWRPATGTPPSATEQNAPRLRRLQEQRVV